MLRRERYAMNLHPVDFRTLTPEIFQVFGTQNALLTAGDAPFFDEAEWVLVCKKLYAQDLNEDCVLQGENILRHYGAKGGWHRVYIGEVVEAYTK